MAFAADWCRAAFRSEYTTVYQHRDLAQVAREVKFAKNALEINAHHRVLDLACGDGRHSGLLIQEGFNVYGCDYSLELVRHAHESSTGGFAQHIQWCDMRSLPYPDATFDCVLNFFTSFGYFESDAENQGVLAEIRRVMKRGGLFLLDFANVTRVKREMRPVTERVIDGLRIREQRAFVENTGRLEKEVLISGRGFEKNLYRIGESIRQR